LLLCLGHGCHKAVCSASAVEHLCTFHKVEPQTRKQLLEYIEAFLYRYDYCSVPLPIDGLAPQPIIPIVDGIRCRDCPFKSQSRDKMRQHANTAHNKKGLADEDSFDVVRLQSWFRDSRERYWVVDESQQESHDSDSSRTAVATVRIAQTKSTTQSSRKSKTGRRGP
jgi:Orsellinic acid/F9775 biosynthesis cluster protein D